MVDEIQNTIKLNREFIEELDYLEKTREDYLKDAARKQGILRGLKEADLANLWTDEGRKVIQKEYAFLHQLVKVEERIRQELNSLYKVELDFYTKLSSGALQVPSDQKNKILRFMSMQDPHYFLENLGILQLIHVFYNTHREEEDWDMQLGNLLTGDNKSIQEMIDGKFKFIGTDWEELIKYNDYEKRLLKNLREKVDFQIITLENLIKRENVGQSRNNFGNYENTLLQKAAQAGAAFLHTSLPSEYSSKRNSGFQDRISSKRNDYYLGMTMRVKGYFKFQVEEELKNKGVNEAVCSEPMLKDVYGKVLYRNSAGCLERQ